MSGPPPEDRLFVYGTLRRSSKRPMDHMLQGRIDFIGTGTFRGRLYDLGSYPGVVPSPDPGDLVTGEIYLLHDPSGDLPILDRYETDEYHRGKHPITLENGNQIQAWVYIFIAPVVNARRIGSGDYLNPESSL